MSEACNAVFLEFSFCFAFYINAICKEAGPAFVLNNHMDKKKYKSITSQKERKGSLEAPTFLIPLLLGRSVCRPWSSPAWLPSGSSSTRPPVLAPDVSVNSGPEQQIPGAGSSSLPFSWEEVCAGHGQVPHGSHLGPAAPASSTCS